MLSVELTEKTGEIQTYLGCALLHLTDIILENHISEKGLIS
jgi:hypothetical protein